jgi:hypothetical protein
VPDHDFLFALDLSDEPHFDRMLGDVAAAVLRYTGYDAASIDACTREIRAALASGVARGQSRCEMRFRASAGSMQISVTYDGGSTWRTTRPLPAES